LSSRQLYGKRALTYLEELWKVVQERVKKLPKGSYTAELARKGLPYVARKFGEESVELIVASLKEEKASVVYEAADVIYHLMVLLAIRGVEWDEVVKELENRARHRVKDYDGDNS